MNLLDWMLRGEQRKLLQEQSLPQLAKFQDRITPCKIVKEHIWKFIRVFSQLSHTSSSWLEVGQLAANTLFAPLTIIL